MYGIRLLTFATGLHLRPELHFCLFLEIFGARHAQDSVGRQSSLKLCGPWELHYLAVDSLLCFVARFCSCLRASHYLAQLSWCGSLKR